ncbi:unnamed protein product, partial [Phaeothamnion confervicola]
MHSDEVMRIGAADGAAGLALAGIFARYGLTVRWLALDCEIPGSYWGDSEAGLVQSTLYVRADTPLHSALHD